MQTMHTSIHILYSFIFPIPSTSLEWQIHVTQGSKDKLRGSQTTNIHQPVMNQPSKLKIGRLVHHFHTVCSLGWCCNLFQDPENRTIPTFVQHKGHGLKQGMSRGGRWSWIQEMKELAGLQRLQSAECRVPNCPHQWDCMIILYYCKVISSNKNHTHNIWKIVSHTHTHIYIYKYQTKLLMYIYIYIIYNKTWNSIVQNNTI